MTETNPDHLKIAPIILGTAGHVDHGKTSLVKALTQFNTDRHPEERKRGLSIDFAVAPYTTKNGLTVGLIDVPGHEDFIKNAVAGTSSIEVILLVVAADDGIMPQTKEHLLIAKYLGAKLIIPVVTKIDLVDELSLTLVKEEIEEELSDKKLEHSAIHFVSSLKNIGLENLKEEIDTTINYLCVKQNQKNKSFRMFIRATFLSKGHGNIVTGVPISGNVSEGENLELFTELESRRHISNQLVQVRGIENYKVKTSCARAQISSAINLKDSETKLLTRGSVLATPNIYEKSRTILCWLRNDAGEIKRGKTYFIHIGTRLCEAQITPLGGNELEINTEGPVQIRFRNPVVLAAGDRLIVRTAKTIAGGIVLSRKGKLPRKSMRGELIAGCMGALNNLSAPLGNLISELYTSAPLVVSKKDLISLSENTFLLEHTQDLLLEKVGKDLWLNNYKKDVFIKTAQSILNRYHREKPLTLGMQANHFFRLLIKDNDQSLIIEEKALRVCLENTKLFKIKNGMVALSSFTPKFSETELKQMERINQLLLKEKFIAKNSLVEELNANEKELNSIIRLLENEQTLRSIKTHVFLNSFLIELKEKISIKFMAQEFSLAQFREAFALSRNIAVLILEHFDSEGFTKRIGDKRLI